MKGLALDTTDGLRVAEDIKLTHSRLERLFFTPVGEAIGHLDKGSRILEYFWEGSTEENAQGILHEIKFLLKAFEPELIATSILVKFSPVENSGAMALIIELSFFWVNNENEEYDVRLIKVKD